MFDLVGHSEQPCSHVRKGCVRMFGGSREGSKEEEKAYLFATRYQPLNQHHLTLLRVVHLLSKLLVLTKRFGPRGGWRLDTIWMRVTRDQRRRASSSTLSARALSPSASCFCSAARARESRTSSSLDRITHSKWRSRSSYCRRMSLRRARTL